MYLSQRGSSNQFVGEIKSTRMIDLTGWQLIDMSEGGEKLHHMI